MFAFYSLAYIAGTFVILSPIIVLGCCVVKSDNKWKAERDREIRRANKLLLKQRVERYVRKNSFFQSYSRG